MGVYIENMEMPTRCEDCFCYRHNAEYDYAYCNISSVNVFGHGNARLNNCPLVPVPPHGRLIDADELNVYDISPVYGFSVMGVTEEDIIQASTIIEEER